MTKKNTKLNDPQWEEFKQMSGMKTYFNERRVKKLKEKLYNYKQDNSKGRRLKKVFCKTCEYLHTDIIVFQAFTNSDCQICGEIMTFHNSDTHKLCKSCATEHNLCRRCGGELD